MSVDRLSALPDDILCYILSFLEMKEAAITCLLSKRWQFLWTELPWLQFEDDNSSETEDVLKFVTRVNRTLAICRRRNFDGVEVNFSNNYNPSFASDVDAWIAFAVKNEVTDFCLLLSGRSRCYHMLPETTYSNPSWTSLTLAGCIVAPPGTIQWPSLTTLWFVDVALDEHTLEKILSGCPVLSSLDLDFCGGFNCLEVNYPSLRVLTIRHDGAGGDLKISAPYLHTLKIGLHSKKGSLWLGNIRSLVIADIEVYGWEEDDAEFGKKIVEQLFGSIRHAKVLLLGHHCIKFLSLITSKWQLPRSTRGCLELYTYRGNKSIPGIVALLKSSPNLETLVIHVNRFYNRWVDIIKNPVQNNDLGCNLFHLKSVRFKIFEDPNPYTGEPLLTLARILLKRAIVLEKMVVDFQGCTSSSAQITSHTMAKTILSYPRSSQKAVVLFC